MNIEKMFKEIVLLRQRLSKDGLLEVAHADHVWTATFEWRSPIATTIIEEIQP